MTENSNFRGFERSIPIALLRAREATMRKFKPHVDAVGLTMQQWRVIRVLAENEKLLASEIAEKCVILPSSISRILNTLAVQELIHDVPDDDARRRTVRLAPRGRLIYQQMAQKSEQVYRAIEEKFPADKMKQLLGLLDELRDAADQIQEHDQPFEGASDGASQASRAGASRRG
jgi:homoprotocatechuate degradation regulator HpaR